MHNQPRQGTYFCSAALNTQKYSPCLGALHFQGARANMKSHMKVIGLIGIFAALAACGDQTTGQACLGPDNDSLVEGMQSECKAGDAVATKHPAYFCDFNYAVAYNDYNSAMCIYSGGQKPERTEQ